MGIVLGVQLLLAPTERVCGELARMGPGCPMLAASAAAGASAASAASDHGDRGSAVLGGTSARGSAHGRHGQGQTAAALGSESGLPCHQPEPAEAGCCRGGSGLGEVAALVPSSPHQDRAPVALATFAPWALSPAGLGKARLPDLRGAPPPLDEPPRYARFSSYLL